ncbi:MAG: hypothetical protein ACE37F_29875 [Nannocystaceae bacterium]|nr:hypothetical protein [bacterium]
MTSRSLLLLLGLPLALPACVDTQELGDPQATDGGSAGETEAPTTETDPGETQGETEGETVLDPGNETDDSIHDDCVELIWSCPSDDLVCLPEGLCVPCAGEGESPASAEGGHCCGGLVQDADGSTCVPEPAADSCRPAGALCGYAGVTQPCCEGTVCNPDTDLCEPDGSKGAEVCADYESPQIDNCAAGGKSSASFSFEGPETNGETLELQCVVGTPTIDGDEESLPLQCDGDDYVLRYTSASPHLVAPVAEDDDVLLALAENEKMPGQQASFSLRTPGGELLLAFVDATSVELPLPIALDEFSWAVELTGCPAFDAGAVSCEDGMSILSGHVSVELGGDESAAEPLQAGGSTSFGHAGRTYDVIVHQANEIVCWDESCAGDEGGPFDRLQLLIVSQ